MAKKMTPKQEAFVREYLIDLNATQAAIRAGYSKKTAKEQASRLLTNVHIQKAIQKAMQERAEKVEVDAEYVLRRLVAVDQMDVLDIMNDGWTMKPLSEWPDVWRQTISGFDVSELTTDSDPIGFLKKIKWPDKVKNLELLGKHVNVQAFKDKVEHSGDVTVEIVQF